MGTGAPPLDRGPPARTEVLHTSERTRVTRLFLTGRTVIRKEPLGADAEGPLHRNDRSDGEMRPALPAADTL